MTPRPGDARCYAIVRTPADHDLRAAADRSGPPATALTPADIQSAYRLPATAGAGQTVAIVDAFGDSHAESDLAVFRAQYGLPACTTANGCFRKVDQDGGTDYPADDAGLGAGDRAGPGRRLVGLPAVPHPAGGGQHARASTTSAAAENAASTWAPSSSPTPTASRARTPTQRPVRRDYDHPGVVVTASTGDNGNMVELAGRRSRT